MSLLPHEKHRVTFSTLSQKEELVNEVFSEPIGDWSSDGCRVSHSALLQDANVNFFFLMDQGAFIENRPWQEKTGAFSKAPEHWKTPATCVWSITRNASQWWNRIFVTVISDTWKEQQGKADSATDPRRQETNWQNTQSNPSLWMSKMSQKKSKMFWSLSQTPPAATTKRQQEAAIYSSKPSLTEVRVFRSADGKKQKRKTGSKSSNRKYLWWTIRNN